MENFYISKIKINKVRHLSSVEIPLSSDEKKHLILTGKNGSGKTSLLDAIALFLDSLTRSNDPMEAQERADNSTKGIWIDVIPEMDYIRSLFQQGKIIVAYYRADRVFKAIEPQHVEKIELKNEYAINDTPRQEFLKYLLDLKMTEALALTGGKSDKAKKIKTWFDTFEDLLKKIFENDSVQLVFDEDSFKFSIHQDGREPFDFNTLSSGYAAVIDIIVDLIIRMEKNLDKKFDFSIPGIVLIDEIETHLHLDLQKKILRFLTSVFPNIQFIVSTHSPFILNSLEEAVIYDLENKILVMNGLSDVPYSGIVEGYFGASEMSRSLQDKFERYKEFAYKSELKEEDYDEIADLEMYLDEIPDYLALRITTEYQRLKQDLRNREDA